MIGLGTLINTAAIILGGIFGLLFGKFMKEEIQETISKTCGVCVLFVGMAGAFEGMFKVVEGGLVSGVKRFGFNSPRLLLGTFENEELGTYTRYTYAPSKDCIILSTKSGTVVVGCNTAEETRELYGALAAKGISVKGDAQ